MNLIQVKGDLFDSQWEFDAIGHGVNCFGAMGAGIAVAFKNKYPAMYKHYAAMCEGRFLYPGMVMHWPMPKRPGNPVVVYNIASQYKPGPDAKIEYLEVGLQWVKFHMEFSGLERLGLPWIGAGIGGLDIKDVLYSVRGIFDDSDVTVTVVEYKEK